MKKQSIFVNAVFAALLALNLNSMPASASESFSSSAILNLSDSISSVPVPITPQNYQQIGSRFFVPIYEEYFVNQFLISGFTYLPSFFGPSDPNFPPTATIYDTSSNTLVSTGTLPADDGLGVLYTAISPSADQPFIAVSTFRPLVPTLTSWDYVLKIYQYDSVNGTINPTPTDTLNWRTWNPNITDVITYNSSTSFSFDGKYLFYTYTIGSTPATRSQIFGAFEITDQGKLATVGGVVTPVAEYTLPAGPDNGLFVPEAVRSFKKPEQNPHKYKLIVGLLGIVPGDLSGGAVQASYVNSFNFDPIGGHIDSTGILPLPAGVQGIDINPDHDRVLLLTHNVSTGPSVDVNPKSPFPTGAPDPTNNFRLYSFNKNAQNNALSYISGHSLGANGENVRWSNSGDFVAITYTPISVTSAFNPSPLPATIPAPIANPKAYSPSVVSTLSFNRYNDTFRVEDTQPASPFAFNNAWKADDSLLSVSGQPTPLQKNIQIYQIENAQ